MASAALDWDSLDGAGEVAEPGERERARLERVLDRDEWKPDQDERSVECFTWSDRRPDEYSVRLLLIEERPQFVPVVCWAFHQSARGRFHVEQTTVLDHAHLLLREDLYDAILVDLGDRCGDRTHEAMDAAEALAHQVPVIVLTGTHFDDLAPVTREDELAALVAREHLACDRLPGAVLDAIRRHRRVGQGGADPVVFRMRD